MLKKSSCRIFKFPGPIYNYGYQAINEGGITCVWILLAHDFRVPYLDY